MLENQKDITDRQRLLDSTQTQVVHQSIHSQFSKLMANLGEAVVITDSAQIILSFNHIAERIFGFRESEIVGLPWSLLAVDEVPLSQRIVPESMVDDLFLKRMGGEIFPAEIAVSPLEVGDCKSLVIVIRDVSERKRAEQALRDSESRFRDLAGSASDWFWETNEYHQLIFISQRIASVLGVNPSAIIGLTFEEHGLECNPDVAQQHKADLEARRPFRDRIFHAGPSEGTDARTLRLSGMPVYDEHDTFVGYRGVGVDITREVAAEKLASRVQQTLEDSIDSLADSVVVFGRDGRLVTCNRAYLRLLEVSDISTLIGLTFEQIMRRPQAHFDTEGCDFESWLAERIASHQAATGVPFTFRMSDGRWILARECRMGNGGIVGVRTDITELKQREFELDALKTRYQLILDSAGEGIIGLDISGQIIFANQTAHSLLGHSANALIGKVFKTEIQPVESDGQAIAAVYTSGVAQHVTNQFFLCRDGSKMPVDYFAAPLMQGDEISGGVVVFRDATLRLQYEKAVASVQQELERLVAERTQELSREVAIRARTETALRESRARMKGITDCLLEGVLVVNGGGDIMFANPSARRILCQEELDELEGLPMDQFLLLGGDTPISFSGSPWRKVAEGQGAIKNDDAVFLISGGRSLAVAYACSPLVIEGGTLAAVILFRDITELKDAQWDAVQASRLASVGQLAAGIAHEINTPTQYIGDNLRFISDAFQSYQKVVLASSQLVDELLALGPNDTAQRVKTLISDEDVDYLSQEVPSAISQSQQGVEQVRHIVLSMKEFSHPGSSSKVMSDINRALESTLTVCRNTWKHVATVQMDFDPNLPQIHCYPSELNQVFLNLIINATHAIESKGKEGLGTITIATKVENGMLEISFKDTGTGIPSSIKDRIFDPFFTTKPVGKGTGQGLAICRDVVVNKHGGRLDVESVDGQGATFFVRLPIAESADTNGKTL